MIFADLKLKNSRGFNTLKSAKEYMKLTRISTNINAIGAFI